MTEDLTHDLIVETATPGASNVDEDRVYDDAHNLVSSRRVEGTRVYDPAGEKLGHVHSLMIDKRSGQVVHVLMAFGGFLGIAGRVHPVPWDRLSYDVDRNAYALGLTREQLENAPTLRLDQADRPIDPAFDARIAGYYTALPMWGL